MLKRLLVLFGLVLVSVLPLSAHAEETTDSAAWVPAIGDTFVADVQENIGYLVHANGDRLQFKIATGRKAYVHYIGRSYRADTPIRKWTAEQFQIKGDRRTFGVSGRFIRLFRDGESSPYGIHSYFKVSDWMQEEQRYFSMGCIVVTEDMMDIMEKTFNINEQKMIVVTTAAPQDELQRMTSANVVTAANGQ